MNNESDVLNEEVEGGRILRIVNSEEDKEKDYTLNKESLEKLNQFYNDFARVQFELKQLEILTTQAVNWIDRLISMLVDKNVFTKEELLAAIMGGGVSIYDDMENESNGMYIPDDDSHEEPPVIL